MIALFTFNLYTVICQLYLSKTGNNKLVKQNWSLSKEMEKKKKWESLSYSNSLLNKYMPLILILATDSKGLPW